jgi:hypothetical protein
LEEPFFTDEEEVADVEDDPVWPDPDEAASEPMPELGSESMPEGASRNAGEGLPRKITSRDRSPSREEYTSLVRLE